MQDADFGAGKIPHGRGIGCFARSKYLSVKEEILRGDLVELRKDVNPDHHEAGAAQAARRIYVIYKPDHARPLRELFFKECGIRHVDVN